MQRLIRVPFRLIAMTTAISLSMVMASVSWAADIDAMIKTLDSGTGYQRIELAKSLEYSGITDERLFDVINKRILSEAIGKHVARGKIDELAWLCKALSTSGMAKYRKTFEQLLAAELPSKLLRHVRNSEANLNKWAEWNPHISSSKFAAKGRNSRDAKHLSMIHSGVPALQKRAAGSVVRDGAIDTAVYDALAEELEKGAALDSKNGPHVDAMGWFCRALGESGNSKYKTSLQQVRDTSPSRKIQKYANKALKALG